MSLENNGFTWVCACDHCGEEHDTGEVDFHEAVNDMKRMEWRITKKAGDWQHECPDCQKSGADDFEDIS